MPKISHIDVPEGLWNKLVESSTVQFAELILSEAQQHSNENNLNVDLTEELNKLKPHIITQDEYEFLENCVMALVRIQNDNYTSSDVEIKQDAAYLDIWNAAATVAEQVNLDVLPTDGYLGVIARTHTEGASKDPSFLS